MFSSFRMAQRKGNECIAASLNPCDVVKIVIKNKTDLWHNVFGVEKAL
jgi:hypothetical protein